MLLTESYKKRIQQLAGIKPLDEAMDMSTKSAIMNKSANRASFNLDMMKKAIQQGQEIGINFQSNNKKYKMPTTKARIIWPVAIGVDKNGDMVVRGYHITGQSEKKARATGSRTAEAENEWRLFKVKNIKTMWLTDRSFNGPLPGYNPRDTAMTRVITSYDPGKAKRYQDSLKNRPAPETENQPVPETENQPEKQVAPSNITNTQVKPKGPIPPKA